MAPALKPPKVFSVHGVSPELLAYSMAKYSRSSLSLEQAMAELSEQKAASFMNTFYFAYGHRSIGDMAHIPLAIENISLLAAIEVVNEQKWDGQERSTRYQEFSGREYYVPDLGDAADAYHLHMASLFGGYRVVFEDTLACFRQEHPKPDGMEEAAYERTLRARAFDVARYLLPLSTLTSIGQITSARTLETQISRLLATPHRELWVIAKQMKEAAQSPAFNPNGRKMRDLAQRVYELSSFRPDWWDLYDTASKLNHAVNSESIAAPTLLKHADPDSYRRQSAAVVSEYVDKAHNGTKVPGHTDQWNVQFTCVPRLLLSSYEPEIECLATAVYQETCMSFNQCVTMVMMTGKEWRDDFMRDLLAIRGKHDEMLRLFRGGEMIFDIQMDIGGMRDLHRHRRCTQILQKFSPGGFASPEHISPRSLEIYREKCRQTESAWREVAERSPGDEVYTLPLGTMCRLLMKMDIAEAVYIAELRSQPAGHISYRRVAYRIFEALEYYAPNVAASIKNRVTHPDAPLDFFKR